MVDNTKWLADAKTRLAITQGTRRRAGSIAAKVEALRFEIEAARAAGKTWKQIALDISDSEELNADAVRIAYDRGSKAQRALAAPVKASAENPAAARKPTGTPNVTDGPQPANISEPVEMSKSVDKPAEASLPDEGLLAGMWAPLLDARDTRGRSSGQTSTEEGRS